ncbi:MAG TPA: D-alanyl-D-alanine carboxypeptidase, partial [Flavisolibacter sp.]|nr:D-alanyl-D-alanine carboxypeptidase [Flavisolibacter sp.]
MRIQFFLASVLASFLFACSPAKQISRSAGKNVLNDPALQNAHVGISVYDVESGKYLYNYQGDKYFVPASNTKIPTCYAAMKYLGDSLVGLRYGFPEEGGYKEHILAIQATGDPSFLHPDYKRQPVFNFLQENVVRKKFNPAFYVDTLKLEDRWGSGWSWNDYDASYMAERNSFPVFGNVLEIRLNDSSKWFDKEVWPEAYRPDFFKTPSHFFDSILNSSLSLLKKDRMHAEASRRVAFRRDIASNKFKPVPSGQLFTKQSIPFVTDGALTTLNVLMDTFHVQFGNVSPTHEKNKYAYECPECDISFFHISQWHTVHSQPTDSLLKPMMHRSDNFFAEQSLLMVSNEVLGVMNDTKIIDTLLKTDFKDLPQKPRWADGSGLSRYNLFTPQDFVFILNKMRTEFGMERIKEILPTGNEGTLTNYYKAENGSLFAKTGTLSGVVALSGFLYTKQNKLLI